MKINMTKELGKHSLVSHIVLHGITYAVNKNLVEKICEKSNKDGNKDTVVDIVITANGEEINLELFVKHWQDQVEELIEKRAKEIVKNKFTDIEDLFYDLRQRLESEIDKRTEDWKR